MIEFDSQVGQPWITVYAFSLGDVHMIDSLPNWSLTELVKQANVKERAPLAKAIARAACNAGVYTAYAPNVQPAPLWQIVRRGTFTVRLNMGSQGLNVYRKKSVHVAGVFLEDANEAFVASDEHYPLVIATAGSNLIVACAAREAENQSRLVDAIILELQEKYAISMDEIRMCMLLGTPAAESSFVNEVTMRGIPHVYTAHARAMYPKLARAGKDETLLIVKRHAP